MRNDLVNKRAVKGNCHVWQERWLGHLMRKRRSLRSVRSEIFIELIQVIIQPSSFRSETLTEVHIALLKELSWIGNNGGL
jgi:hypothetical protein